MNTVYAYLRFKVHFVRGEFSSRNNLLNLCVLAVNLLRLFFSQKMVLNVIYYLIVSNPLLHYIINCLFTMTIPLHKGFKY